MQPDKLDYCGFLTPFEKLAINLRNRPIDKEHLNFDFVKTRLKSLTLSAYYVYDSAQLPLNISKAEIAALNNLSKNRNIIIIRPDKGNGVVILNRSDYIEKVEALLADASKFSKLDIDTLEICQRRENRLVRFLRDTLLKQKSYQRRFTVSCFLLVAFQVFSMAYLSFIKIAALLDQSYQQLIPIITI